jgi:nucleolar protein 4
VEDQDLRALFLPYGPIHSIDIPVSAPEESTPDAKPRARGFAFVWMLSKPDAEKALEGLNGSKVRAGLAARLAKEKQKKKKEARLERKAEEGAADGEEIEAKERIIAVDWALSKNRWEEEKGRLEQEAADDNAEDSDLESGDAESESGEESDHHGVNDETDGSVDGDDSGDEDDRSGDEAPAKPQLPQTDVGTTLFVRNVPYEATEDDLRQLSVLIFYIIILSLIHCA